MSYTSKRLSYISKRFRSLSDPYQWRIALKHIIKEKAKVMSSSQIQCRRYNFLQRIAETYSDKMTSQSRFYVMFMSNYTLRFILSWQLRCHKTQPRIHKVSHARSTATMS